MDSKINGLKPGGSVTLFSHNGITCSAERSCDGKKVRFVRTFKDGSWTVFHSSTF